MPVITLPENATEKMAEIQGKLAKNLPLTDEEKQFKQDFADTQSANRNAKLADAMKRFNKHVARLASVDDADKGTKADKAAQIGRVIAVAMAGMPKLKAEDKKTVSASLKAITSILRDSEETLAEAVEWVQELVELGDDIIESPMYNRYASVLGTIGTKNANFAETVQRCAADVSANR